MPKQSKWQFSTTSIKFDKRPLEDIIADSQKIDTKVIAAEVLTWLVTNVENYVDNQNTIFKLDLILDETSNMPQTKKLQDLYRAIPDDEDCSKKELENATKCRRMLDGITEEAYKHIVNAKEVLDKLFERMIFYYEKIIPNPDNKRRALEIDEELKVLLVSKEKAKNEKEKAKIQKQIMAKVKEGEELVKFEQLTGTVVVSKFEYEAFSLGVGLLNNKPKEDAEEIIMKENEEKAEIVKQYTIPEGFTLWLELNYKQKLRPTAIF